VWRLADQGNYDGAQKTLTEAGEQFCRLAPSSSMRPNISICIVSR